MEYKWEEMPIWQKERMIETPDFDYEKYQLDKSYYPLLYAHNKKICENIDLDKMTLKEINYLTKYNENFDYKKFWDKLQHNQKYNIISFRKDFDYEYYWNELNDNLREILIRQDYFDFDKYWDQLTDKEIPAYIKTSLQEIPLDKQDRVKKIILNNINLFEFYFGIPFGDVRDIKGENVEYKGETYTFYQYDIKNLNNFQRNIFGELEIIKLYKLDSIFEENGNQFSFWTSTNNKYKLKQNRSLVLYEYKNIYIMPCFNICFDNMKYALRAKKLKNILNENL